MKVNIKVKILAAFLCVLVLFACTITTFAAPDQNTNKKGSITISFPLENAKFDLFKIGKVSGGEVELFDEFAKYRVDMESKSAADTMTLYLKKDKVAPFKSAITNASKEAVFNNLDRGVYLVAGNSFVEDYCHYYLKSFIVYIPYNDGNTENWNVRAEAKYEYKDYREEVLSVNVLKMWCGITIGDPYPEIKVLLLRNWEVYDTVILNEENNWKYEWKNLDAQYIWNVVEETVPIPFMVSIEQEDELHTLTNTDDSEEPSDPSSTQPSTTTTSPTTPDSSTTPTDSTESSTVPTVPDTGDSRPTKPTEPTQPTTKPDDKLTQTGQLNWPIPILCFVGAVFLIISVAVMRKKQ